MLLQHYLGKILTALFGGLFVFGGIYTFGNALLFDRIFIGVLVFTAFVCRKDVNVIGVVIILVLQRVFEEGGWYALLNFDQEITKIVFYAVAIGAYFRLRFDNLSRLLFVTLIISIASELYWFFFDRSAPQIHWLIITLTINLFVRYAIFSRVGATEQFFPSRALSINLDWHIYKLNAFAALLQTLTILEYIVRNVFGMKQVEAMYYAYPYLMHAIGTYAIWVIFHESYKLILPKVLKA